MSHSITLSRDIQASPEAVYRAFHTPSGLLDWCAAAVKMDTGKGHYLFLWADGGYRLSGTVAEQVENQALLWLLDSPASGSVRIQIRPVGDGVQVSLKHSGEDSAEPHLNFWNSALDNLVSVLETGLDRRIYDRPMIGILIGGLLDEDSQTRYGVPVSFGIIVSGTVSGLGAEELGLLEDDVLVELDGVELRDYRDLPDIISRFKAGDQVTVAWYRGAVKHTGRLRLSGRPEPYRPATPPEFAEYLEGIYALLDEDLADIVAGVPESAAAVRPLETEWNVHEIIAHIIATERAAQLWVAAVLRGETLPDWGTNDRTLIRSIVDVYPTIPELIRELGRTQAQTVALVRRLPPELMEHKGTYMKIVTELGEHGIPLHTRMHYDTIRTQLQELQPAASHGSR